MEDRKRTERFIKEARAFAEGRGWQIHTLSRYLFNKNPYGFERLEDSLKTGKGGPPHINVLDAFEAFDSLRSKKNASARVSR